MLPRSPSTALFKASRRFSKIIQVTGDKQARIKAAHSLYQRDLTKSKRIQGRLNLRRDLGENWKQGGILWKSLIRQLTKREKIAKQHGNVQTALEAKSGLSNSLQNSCSLHASPCAHWRVPTEERFSSWRGYQRTCLKLKRYRTSFETEAEVTSQKAHAAFH